MNAQEVSEPVLVLVGDEWLWQLTCQGPGCHVVFTAHRRDAKTHTSRCRMALSRARRRAAQT